MKPECRHYAGQCDHLVCPRGSATTRPMDPDIQYAIVEGYVTRDRKGELRVTPKGVEEARRLMRECAHYPVWVSEAANELEVEL